MVSITGKLITKVGMPNMLTYINLYLSGGWLGVNLIHSPHLLVRATSERFLLVGGIFRAILASER